MTRFYSRGMAAIVVLACLLVATPMASAQGRRGGLRFFGGASPTDLASLDQVQNELKFSDEQKTKVGELADQYRSDRRDLFQQGFGPETRQKMEQLSRDSSAKVFEILDDTQRGRLTGILIQVNGARALNEPVVTEALKFTDEQAAKLAEVNEANLDAFRSARDEMDGLSDDERRAKITQMADDAEQKMMDVLTTEQQQQFEQLKGEPIDVDMSSLRRGRRGGGN
jgi:Spy/CpxP family protein refolding chaperone